RYPTGFVRHDSQLGPGELDLVGAQTVSLAEIKKGDGDLEAKSWFALSSDYARPDPTWPVWGTIELRHADGSIASGLDGTKLSVSAEGGVLVEPLRKVRHGMFRFAFAGSEGTGGQTIRVAVRYAGQLIGQEQSIPIGADSWQARGAIGAEGGGCKCSF